MGFMFNNELDEYIEEFIKFPASAQAPVVDLGCAYGFVTKHLLNAGIKKVIANDLDQGHLEFLWKSLEATPVLRESLVLKPGSALELDFHAESLSGILAENRLHFLTPSGIRKAFALFAKWLQPNVMLCVLTGAIRTGLYRNVLSLVEDRTIKGEEWPGYFKTSDVSDHHDSYPPK